MAVLATVHIAARENGKNRENVIKQKEQVTKQVYTKQNNGFYKKIVEGFNQHQMGTMNRRANQTVGFYES